MNRLVSRQIDELGRIVIPIEFRKKQNWNDGDTIAIYEVNGVIIMYLSEKNQQPADEPQNM